MLSAIKLAGYTVNWYHQESDQSNAPNIHFSGANGFPVASYQEFFDYLKHDFTITAMDFRATWLPSQPPPNSFTTDSFAEDLIQGIEQQHHSPVIGMGHSWGGLITLIAASKRPDLFSKLLILEPPDLPQPWMHHVMKLFPRWFLFRYSSFVRGSLERQAIWPSVDAFKKRYASHRTFKHFTRDSFRAYAEHGLRERNDGQFELVFQPQWEAHIFCKIKPLWRYLKQASHPILVLRAAQSHLNKHETFERYRALFNSTVQYRTLDDSHHLFTHEVPDRCAGMVLDWLK